MVLLQGCVDIVTENSKAGPHNVYLDTRESGRAIREHYVRRTRRYVVIKCGIKIVNPSRLNKYPI